MVYLSERSLLICSVYDSIQVWDMSKNERVNLFRGHLLDSKLERTNCFHAFGNALITGTNTGKIHAFDLLSSQHLGESQRCYGIDMICDIKSYGKTLLAIGKVFFSFRYYVHFSNNRNKLGCSHKNA